MEEFYRGHKRGYYSTQEVSKEGTGAGIRYEGLKETTLRFQTWGRVSACITIFIDIRFLPWPSMVVCMAGAKKAGKGAGVNSEMEKEILSLLSLFPP